MSTRREFIGSVGAVAIGSTLSVRAVPSLPFHLSVLTDEISPDLGRACEVAAREFGLQWVELRAMHGKNIMEWDAADIAEARKILERYQLQVSELASPVFKTDWPGAPKSPFSPKNPVFRNDFT